MMAKETEMQIRRYLKAVKANLTCPSGTKSAFLSMIRDRINAFIDENPDATYESLVENFGEPEALAEEISQEEYSEAFRQKKRNMLILKVVAACLVVVCVAISIVLTVSLKNNHFHVENSLTSMVNSFFAK